MRVKIDCAEVRTIVPKVKDGQVYLYKLSVVEKRNVFDCRNGRDTDAWNITVLRGNTVAFDTASRCKVGDEVLIDGRAESKTVGQDCKCGAKWTQYFTEIVATNIENFGGHK